MIGFAAAGAVCWSGYKNVPMITQPLCLVMSDEFETLDTTNTWHREIDTGGFQFVCIFHFAISYLILAQEWGIRNDYGFI